MTVMCRLWSLDPAQMDGSEHRRPGGYPAMTGSALWVCWKPAALQLWRWLFPGWLDRSAPRRATVRLASRSALCLPTDRRPGVPVPGDHCALPSWSGGEPYGNCSIIRTETSPRSPKTLSTIVKRATRDCAEMATGRDKASP